MRVVGAGFEVTPTGLDTCLARTAEERPLKLIAARGELDVISSMRSDETARISLTGALCISESATVAGSGTIGSAVEAASPTNLYTEALADGIVEEMTNRLVDVNARVGGTPTTILTLRNRTGYRIRLIAIHTETERRTRFGVTGAPETNCGATLDNNATCRIGIVATTAVANDWTRVRIDYQELGFYNGNPLSNEFRVTAVT